MPVDSKDGFSGTPAAACKLIRPRESSSIPQSPMSKAHSLLLHTLSQNLSPSQVLAQLGAHSGPATGGRRGAPAFMGPRFQKALGVGRPARPVFPGPSVQSPP